MAADPITGKADAIHARLDEHARALSLLVKEIRELAPPATERRANRVLREHLNQIADAVMDAVAMLDTAADDL